MLESQRAAAEALRRLTDPPGVKNTQDYVAPCEQPHQISITDPIAELRQEIDKLWKALKKKKETEPPPPPGLNVNDIITLVASDYGVTRKDMISERRDRASVRHRNVAMWLARANTLKSTSLIGRCFRRDHSTVITNLKRFRHLLDTDDELRARVLRLQALVHERTAALGKAAADRDHE